jgi:LEA14-like dessication related protein
MKKNFIWIAAAAAAIFFILRRSSFAKNLIFSFNNIKLVGKLLQPELIITLSVQNPTRQAAKITAISGTLYLDDKAISNISNFNQQVIQPQIESLISFSARPGVIGIANVLKEIFFSKTKNKQYTFKFIGSANVDGVLLPIDQEFIL